METTKCRYGGYDYDFVDTPVDHVICVICHLPSREPYMTECCGHVFCKSCLDRAKATKYTACSMCKDKCFNAFCNKQINREVQSLHVYCTNKEKGCKWKGQVRDIRDHLGNSEGCQFEEVKCLNECEEMIQRRFLIRHLESEYQHREVECQYCHDKMKLLFADGTHLEECPKVPLPCPNHCEAVGMILRENMEAHRRKCPLEMIQCEYHDVGCEVRMLRKRRQDHEEGNMEKHLCMTKDQLASTKSELASTNNRLNNLEVLLRTLTGSGSIDLSSVNFNPSNQARWSWSIQLATVNVMEPTCLLDEQTCPAMFKLSGVHRFSKSKNETNNIDWVKSFYSHERGYNMEMWISNFEDHFELRLYVNVGLYDDYLQWPLRAKFKVTVLNQIIDDEHVSVTLTYDDNTDDECAIRRYEEDQDDGLSVRCKLISKRDLYEDTPTCIYVRNDSIFLKVCKV